MRFNYIGDSGISVSELSLGTMNFFSEADLEMSTTLTHQALDAGINAFDCADLYSNGEAERYLGKILKGLRNEVVISSKSYFPTSSNINHRGNSRRHIQASIETSLKRLQTDYIDFFYLHRFDENTPIETSIQCLEDSIARGKILHYGLSNFAAWQVVDCLGSAVQARVARPTLIQPMYNLLKRQAEVELFPMAQAKKLGCITYSPLAAGLLTGKFHKESPTPENDSRMIKSKAYQQRYQGPNLDRTVNGFIDYCTTNQLNPIPTAIAWAKAHPAVSSVLIGARNQKQLAGCLEAADMFLDSKTHDAISLLSHTPPNATDRREEQMGLSVAYPQQGK